MFQANQQKLHQQDSHQIFMAAVGDSSYGNCGLAEDYEGGNKLVQVLPKKVPEKPKRPLTAYNFFFQEQRQKLLDEFPAPKKGKRGGKRSHGRVGFAELAHLVSNKWRSITAMERLPYDELAVKEKMRFHYAKQQWSYIKAAIEEREEKEQEKMIRHSKIEHDRVLVSPQPLSRSSSDDLKPFPIASVGADSLAARLGQDGVDLVIKTFAYSDSH